MTTMIVRGPGNTDKYPYLTEEIGTITSLEAPTVAVVVEVCSEADVEVGSGSAAVDRSRGTAGRVIDTAAVFGAVSRC